MAAHPVGPSLQLRILWTGLVHAGRAGLVRVRRAGRQQQLPRSRDERQLPAVRQDPIHSLLTKRNSACALE